MGITSWPWLTNRKIKITLWKISKSKKLPFWIERYFNEQVIWKRKNVG